MGKEETRAAFQAMANDVDIASAVEKGDFTELDAGDLTPAEQALLTAAATELDDTAGFAAYLKLDGVDGRNWKVEEGEAFKVNRPRIGRVLDYIKFDG
jgi:hypothetical protein